MHGCLLAVNPVEELSALDFESKSEQSIIAMIAMIAMIVSNHPILNY